MSTNGSVDTQKLVASLKTELFRPKKGGLICQIQAAVQSKDLDGKPSGEDWSKLDEKAKSDKVGAILAKNGGLDKLEAADFCAVLGAREADFLPDYQEPSTVSNGVHTEHLSRAPGTEIGTNVAGTREKGPASGAEIHAMVGDSNAPDPFDIRAFSGDYSIKTPASRNGKKFSIDVYSGDITYNGTTYSSQSLTITRNSVTGRPFVAFADFNLNFFIHLTDNGIQTVSFTGTAGSDSCSGDRQQSDPGAESTLASARDWTSLMYGVVGIVISVLGIGLARKWQQSTEIDAVKKSAKDKALKRQLNLIELKVNELRYGLKSEFSRRCNSIVEKEPVDIQEVISRFKQSSQEALNNLDPSVRNDLPVDESQRQTVQDGLVENGRIEISNALNSQFQGPLLTEGQEAEDHGFEHIEMTEVIGQTINKTAQTVEAQVVNKSPSGDSSLFENIAGESVNREAVNVAAEQQKDAADNQTTLQSDQTTEAEAVSQAQQKVDDNQHVIDQNEEGSDLRQEAEGEVPELQRELQEAKNKQQETNNKLQEEAKREADMKTAGEAANDRADEFATEEAKREKVILGEHGV